ncbi:MAG TPA: putative glycolipid-binding domain-containing protein [Thermoanaerobaculia bacterium]|nr:putative glycolipid-binding domain-containing protein [Thermoanaerobaculia bacterium]
METHTVHWRRVDLPGHEVCRLQELPDGWQLSGETAFAYERKACRLDYAITCDGQWQTLSAKVAGWVGDRRVDVEVEREPSGLWRLDGQECSAVAGCVDVDLNFSPSTNLLPIRRLDLVVGQMARVRAAWLRFPSFALEPLEQSYTRLEPDRYRYESAGGQFVAHLGVDDAGLVTDYGRLWVREDLG